MPDGTPGLDGAPSADASAKGRRAPEPAAAPPRVVLGVSGGIAAYKACEVLRRMRAEGWDVTVVPTAAALKFVGVATWEALAGRPVSDDVFFDIPAVTHVATGKRADLVVVAPATADLMARAATGQADDLLTATLLVAGCPVLLAPAMHTEMWEHPATVANCATLRDRGVTVVDPAVGRLTGPDSGPGRLPEPEHVVALAELLLIRPDALPHDLAGHRIVISAGGTREPLDPVRFLGNRSSGRQGYALALVAAARGADVTLVAANSVLADPPGVTVVPVQDARDLQRAMVELSDGADAVVMAAAVADYRPATQVATKIKKVPGAAPDPLHLAENPDILAGLSLPGPSRPRVVVGFAAETGDDSADPGASVLRYARQKLARKGCDLLVVNRVDAGRAFEVADNAGLILAAGPGPSDGPAGGWVDSADSTGRVIAEIPLGPKTVLAAAVCDALAARLRPAR